MSSNINNTPKQELAEFVFNDELKTQISTTLIANYGVKTVEFQPLSYGMGIRIFGSDSFSFILAAITKVSGISANSFGILGENKKDQTAFYVYLPEKDKSMTSRLKSRTVKIK